MPRWVLAEPFRSRPCKISPVPAIVVALTVALNVLVFRYVVAGASRRFQAPGVPALVREYQRALGWALAHRKTTIAAAVGSFVAAVAAPATAVEAAGTTSAYVAMPTSQRLLDTRQATPVPAGGTISIAVTGAAPLPAPGTVTAVVLNLTVTPPSGPGFWTVWPHTRPALRQPPGGAWGDVRGEGRGVST